ncbi:laccase [Cantharellus anzutake]|uniref:laccase n=1 Tax=Cantharellus anzutake TaxID=1750568 RepID=UPI0019051520|nr:laccase [Cantharellus anzutake]KAF8342651.1 laccase [Cantharellus anzutake]
MDIVNAKISPDNYTRNAITVGGALGPLLTASKDDNFRITVNDKLNDSTMLKSTSVHWHGLFQHRTADMDGVAFVSQCPIAPNNSFTYHFATAGQTGTYWYHSHYSTQYCDGLRGPIVIYDPNDPQAYLYDVDDSSTVITLADWYHTASQLVFNKTSGVSPTPDSNLINGIGRYNGSTNDLAVISVTHGKRYRLRIVNMACHPNYVVSIDNHTLTVIETEGTAHRPVTVDSIQIFSGQRYSVVVTANQMVGNYWIRASPSTGTSGFTGGINSAILRYVGAAKEEPSGTTQTVGTTLNETSLIPLENPGAPGGSNPADVSINIAIAFTNASFSINGVVYKSPTVPVLLQIMSGASSVSDLLPSGSIYSLPSNKTVEITIPGGTAGAPHPFHLHGHNFHVVRSAGSTTYNYVNPPRRDVVSTGSSTSDNVTIRFQTDNPGPWFLHCHIDWHLEGGLAIVFAENIAAQVNGTNSEIIDTEWEKLCPIYDALPSDDY